MTPGLIAVTAHDLLNAVSVVKATLLTLEEPDRIPAATRDELIVRSVAQIDHVSIVLKDLIRGHVPTLHDSVDLRD